MLLSNKSFISIVKAAQFTLALFVSYIQAISHMNVVDSKIDLQHSDASKPICRQRRLNSRKTLAGGAECM